MPMSIRRILLVVRWPVGGIRTYLKYVYPQLCQRLSGVAISMVTPHGDEFDALSRDLADLNIKYVDVGRDCSVLTLAAAVNRELRRAPYDLIHSHGFTAALAAAVAAKLRRVPHITTVHDILQRTQFVGLQGQARRFALAMALRLVDIVQAVGEDAQRNIVAHLGPGLGRRVRVVRNGILTQPILQAAPRDLRAELRLDPHTFLIGFFGRFMAQKGFHYLVEAVRILREHAAQRARPFHVVSFGGGGFIREEQAAIERSGLKSCFSFLPFVPEAAAAMKGVDVVAIPSLWEAMPLLPMEAMVAGVPVVGTSCIGLAEVLANTPATVVTPADARALAGALEHEASHSSRTVAGNFANIAAQRFDVAACVAGLIELMRELGRRRPGRA
jgi:glycosyltransferase involved in cell wall biosynthesis